MSATRRALAALTGMHTTRRHIALFFASLALAACTVEEIRVQGHGAGGAVEPAEPDEEPAEPGEEPDDVVDATTRDAGRDAGRRDAALRPNDAALDATTLDGSRSDGGDASDSSIDDASDAGDGSQDASNADASDAAPVCAVENASCVPYGSGCCQPLRCSGQGQCICEGVRCGATGRCCAGSPYCVAPQGFYTLECSASPGFEGYACWQTSDCASYLECKLGKCTRPCTPSCGGRQCGSDGCGGTCGTCPPGSTCSAGQCVSPPPPTGCDPVTNTGCSSPNECIVLSNETTQCALVGTGTHGDPCSSTVPCAGGYGCFAGTCRKICLLGSSTVCPSGTSCSGVSGWVRYGACG